MKEERKRLLTWCCKQLVGPPPSDDGGDLKIKKMNPLDRFPCGVLFPVISGEEGEEAEEDDYEEGDGSEVESAQVKRRFVPPSSAGFSFFVTGECVELELSATAACYDTKDRVEGGQTEGGQLQEWVWTRHALSLTDSEQDTLVMRAPGNTDEGVGVNRVEIFKRKACVDTRWRKFRSGWLVTVTLCNQQKLEVEDSGGARKESKEKNERSIFEAELKCRVLEGSVGDYPRVDRALLSDEERELEVQYRHKKIYAVGHGTAVDWDLEGEKAPEFRSVSLPRVEVPSVTANVGGGSDCYRMDYLAGIADNESNAELVSDTLAAFVASYSRWIAERRSESIGCDDDEAASRIVDRMETAAARMEKGINLLRVDDHSRSSFALANRVMADQMKQSGLVTPLWRPFQLAFLLATIESVVNEDSEDRDLVDLIWFPTGGGKTEAYLGLIAFLIAWRRRRYGSSSGGTTILMRYTLRLLTTQQFERATRMICAMERIRRCDPDARLGDEPITIGLWVGGDTSPNNCDDAKTIIQAAQEKSGEPPVKLVVQKCPWCEEDFQPRKNYRVGFKKFTFHCLNEDCDFGRSAELPLPVQVVDEALYKAPPTLLIGTIDKFARLPWKKETGHFFGENGNRPPEMVIQDELHLISSALGSVAGLYEAGIDTILASRGVSPKYIASTATIRMAEEQVRRLYGREVAVFPPPGLCSSDSFFAKAVPLDEKPGRLYVGYFAASLSRDKCLGPLAGALMAGPDAVFSDYEENLDAWWTQLVYHGSLKGVGVSHGLMENDVKERFHRLQEEFIQQNDHVPLKWKRKERFLIEQLTSQRSAEENAETFEQLKKHADEANCLDVALATNMVSVGLDVDRLALMVINGQPLTTAEYIQSSSRVGRSDVPGLVFANYYRDQARSLSHYENFRAYHESFYRFVEPSSVTPFTAQAMKRALHAAIVSAVRHGDIGMEKDKDAGSFSLENDAIKVLLQRFKRRLKNASGHNFPEVENALDKLTKAWAKQAGESERSRMDLVYTMRGDTKNADRLLHSHGDEAKGLWETMNSMRNVEDNALVKPLVKQRRQTHG